MRANSAGPRPARAKCGHRGAMDGEDLLGRGRARDTRQLPINYRLVIDGVPWPTTHAVQALADVLVNLGLGDIEERSVPPPDEEVELLPQGLELLLQLIMDPGVQLYRELAVPLNHPLQLDAVRMLLDEPSASRRPSFPTEKIVPVEDHGEVVTLDVPINLKRCRVTESWQPPMEREVAKVLNEADLRLLGEDLKPTVKLVHERCT
jgi:hypothetical protein